MIKLTDENGVLLPSIRNLINLIFLTVGVVIGWFAHGNWALRGEANQLVDDAKEMQKIEKRFDEEEANLEKRIEQVKHKAVSDDCLLYPVDILDGLRGKSGTQGQQTDE